MNASRLSAGLPAYLLALTLGAAGAPAQNAPAAEEGEDKALVGRGSAAYDPERAIFGTLPRYRSPDGDVNAGVGFIFQMDAGLHTESPDSADSVKGVADRKDGLRDRRGVLLANALLFQDYIVFGSWDLFDTGDRVTDGLRSIMLIYRGFDPLWLAVGQQPTIAPLDAAAFSDRSFMEETMASGAFAYTIGTPSLGVSATHRSPNHYIRAGLFGEPMKNFDSEREGYGLHWRAAWAPVAERTRAAHIGFAGYWRKAPQKPGADGGHENFFARPELRIDDELVVDTGAIERIDDYLYTSFELAGVWGPFSVQAEYQRVAISRVNGGRLAPWPDLTLNGHYLVGSWFLTGESRNYYPRFGAFWRVKPKRDFDPENGGWGALEAAARLSRIDLDDREGMAGGVMGGSSDNITLALNWYLSAFGRVSLNYVHADVDRKTAAGQDIGGTVDGVAVRFQWVF